MYSGAMILLRPGIRVLVLAALIALVPLGQTRVIGVLALGAEDPQRFYADMGTLYLRRIGELTAGALAAFSTFLQRLLTPTEFDLLTARLIGSVANADA